MNKVKTENNNETVSCTGPSAVSSIIPFGTLSPANSTNSGILRSPSHESFATDLSLMSLSSLGSEISRMRGSAFRSKNHSGGDSAESGDERRSPVIMDGGVGGWVARKTKARNNNVGLLQVPSEQYGKRGVTDDVLYEEENEAIRNCGALSSMLGLMRSFSTSDLDQNVVTSSEKENLRSSVSEMVLNSWKHYDMPYGRLEYTSRSCSTWVAVGDVSTTSQLPSPQTLANYATEHPEITAIDFVRAINKKVRQVYIRRRLESTYKALERLTRSELSLDLPSIAVPVPTASTSGAPGSLDDSSNYAPSDAPGAHTPLPQFHISTELGRSIRHELQISAVGFHGVNKTLSLTVKDIERDKGKPLSKYERNMMIFNWLQSLDENAFDQLA
ncbi:uncharacterized protein LOC129958528 [Argiope bruennichi]|uniref:Uncharacterized protein n=1 Tax=Argiope bruennichi TaxID=94029 RepID=A0A8T0F775_ARGBR|nr:uncharacterized protein LOC129958528 [Argiope bruennichi]KAF8784843.1 hypothetical protein HNY73_010460 [Argiope bruennichi]